MPDTTITLDRKEINKVRPWIQAAFPEYKGFKVTLVFSDKPVNIESFWDSGCRDYFALVGANGVVKQIPQNGAPFGQRALPPVAPTQEIHADRILRLH